MVNKVMKYTYKGETLQLARRHNLPEITAILDQFSDYDIEEITIEIVVSRKIVDLGSQLQIDGVL